VLHLNGNGDDEVVVLSFGSSVEERDPFVVVVGVGGDEGGEE
jgi:hypothetical protein